MRQPDFSHAAAGQQASGLPGAETPSRCVRVRLRAGSPFAIVSGQQTLEFAAQRHVAGAVLVEKSAARGFVELASLVEELLKLFPAFAHTAEGWSLS